jgi:hypothetical protein
LSSQKAVIAARQLALQGRREIEAVAQAGGGAEGGVATEAELVAGEGDAAGADLRELRLALELAPHHGV